LHEQMSGLQLDIPDAYMCMTEMYQCKHK